MLCPIEGIRPIPGRLGDLTPERVLFDFDGPRTFTARDAEGELLLLHQCGQSGDAWRYFVVPFSEALLAQLETGRIDLRTALNQPRLWVADLGRTGIDNLVLVRDYGQIAEYLPTPGTMLAPELEPLLSVRSKGKHVELGRATLGVLRAAVDNVRNALKILAEYATGETGRRGQPSARTRRYYDLPATILAGSVQVSALPESDGQPRLILEDEVWQRMEAVLQRGFEEAAGTVTPSRRAEPEDEELKVALRAVYLLAPPAYGPIEVTEISGRLAPASAAGNPIVMTRETRSSLSLRVRAAHEARPEIVQKQGFIGEIDRDESTCLLRDDDGNLILKLAFEDALFDLVLEAFEGNHRVDVVAWFYHPSGPPYIVAIAPERP